MSEMRSIRCSIYRAGTSKGIYLLESDLPRNAELRDKVVLAIFGSPDKRQIDGLGGADPLTSKMAIVGPPSRPDADIDYTFGQVAMEEPKVFYRSICGNITSGVGPFAVNSGLVKVKDGLNTIRMYNRNTERMIVAEVEVKDGKAACLGDYAIAGVPGTGSKVAIDFAGAAGALTGKVLPTGNAVDVLDVPGVGTIEASIVDSAACQIYVRARDLGLTGTESPAVVDAQPELLEKLEAVRAYGAYVAGLASTPTSASTERRNTPHVAIVSEAQDYANHLKAETIAARDMDFCIRMMFMQITHKTYAGTGSICLGVASRIPGTLVNQAMKPEAMGRDLVRFGHPAGIIEVEVAVRERDGRFLVERSAIGRTARRIMEGVVYVPESLFAGPAW